MEADVATRDEPVKRPFVPHTARQVGHRQGEGRWKFTPVLLSNEDKSDIRTAYKLHHGKYKDMLVDISPNVKVDPKTGHMDFSYLIYHNPRNLDIERDQKFHKVLFDILISMLKEGLASRESQEAQMSVNRLMEGVSKISQTEAQGAPVDE